MVLVEEAGETVATIKTDVKLSGRIASMGQGVIVDVTKRMVDAFSANLAAMLATPEPAAAAPAAAPGGETSAPGGGTGAAGDGAGARGDASTAPSQTLQSHRPPGRLSQTRPRSRCCRSWAQCSSTACARPASRSRSVPRSWR